jgi:hypothetical protein
MSPEDERLVSFLRQHCPSPPPSEVMLEEKLLKIIEQESKVPHKPNFGLLGALTSLIAALILMIGGHYRWFNATPKVANLADEDLEAFLIDSWSDTLGESRSSIPVTHSDTIWTVLTEPHLTYSTYHP